MEYLFLVLSYIIGSIPFGLLLTKAKGLEDIRNIGSGNIGATNVLRTGNKLLAFLTLLLDGLKGALVVIIGMKYLHHHKDFVFLGAALAVIGHMFPIWLKFKGGKGVATYIAIILTFDIRLGVLYCFMWLLVFSVSKISSLSSIIASISLPLFSLAVFVNWKLTLLYTLLSLMIISKHYENIIRLINREEKKLNI